MNGSDIDRMRCLVHVFDKLLEADSAAQPFAEPARVLIAEALRKVAMLIDETGKR